MAPTSFPLTAPQLRRVLLGAGALAACVLPSGAGAATGPTRAPSRAQASVAGSPVHTPVGGSPVRGPGAAAAGPYAPGTVLVGFRAGVSGARRAALTRLVSGRAGHSLQFTAVPGSAERALTARLGSTVAITVPRGTVPDAVQALRRRSRWVRFAEPDYRLHADGIRSAGSLRPAAATAASFSGTSAFAAAALRPNDPSFGLQWGALNTGQQVQGISGTAGADDSATRAWGVSTGSRSIVIGEVDSGIDYTHPDLAANVWSNPGGIGGCAGGTHGYNVLNSTCNPMDDDAYYGGHGSHVAGIMGAVTNNGVGVAGVNWATSILPVKWLDSNASGTTSGLISALNWMLAAKQAGVDIRVVNDSPTYEGTAYSQALSDEIDQLGAAGILFVTAAGNTGENDDNPATVRYPCSYDRPTEICVTATDQNDRLPSWANTGPNSVDLAAPGDNIYSTLRNGGYGIISGGSMASAQVSGAAALILSVQSMTPSALKSDILGHVDPLPSLAGMVRTGGRLDICAALPGCGSPAPLTFGTTTQGGSTDAFSPNRKRVNAYSLGQSGSVSKLSIYLSSGASSGQADLEGIIYSDASGAPGTLLGTTRQLVFSAGEAAGWYDLSFPAAVSLSAGRYWIGVITGGTTGVAAFRYTSVSGSRDYNSNTYTSGPTGSFGSVKTDSDQMSLYAAYSSAAPPAAPVDLTAPAISGQAQTGQQLSASTGTWSNTPTAYAYQWSRCDSGGGACSAISGASAATYVVSTADVSHTLRVAVTASNAGGASAPATSPATAVIASGPLSFGSTALGGSADTFSADRKRVNAYSLGQSGSVSKLSVYLSSAASSGQADLEGIIYSDANGAPGTLLGKTGQLVFSGGQASGWYDLSFPSALSLAAGRYWIGVISGGTSGVAGFRYTSVSGSRDYNANPYTSGPTSAFGSFSTDSEQMSLYATYTAG